MKLPRDPLLHFLVIGAVLFGVFHFVGDGDESAPDEIIVSAGQIASMEAIFSRTWQRPPTNEEIQALVNEYVRDEVLYRAGVAMGLDRDDSVIRRRIRQKLEFVADLSADAEPTDAELKAFVADHPTWFRAEPRVSFSHVYFQVSAGGPNTEEIERLRNALNAGTADASEIGDPIMMGSDFRELTRLAVAQTFGESFAASIDRARPGDWIGPVTSVYGKHLVRVSGRVDARELPFEEVREAARREWLHGRKVAANEALYEKLKSRHVIRVEDAAAQPGEEKRAEAAP